MPELCGNRVTPPHARGALGHVPALDGLRGIALLLVMLYHANLLAMGWLGVQLFFVLSGYLITGVLIRAQDRGPAALRHFYIRRALRILPAYFAFLLLAFALAHLDVLSATTGIGYAASFTYNVFRALVPDAGSRWLDHMWSLSVEEHLYLLWPLLILWLRGGWRWAALLVLVLLAPLWRGLVGHGLVFEFAFPEYAVGILTPSHLDAAAFGALAFLLQSRLAAWPGLGWVLSGLGILTLAAGMAVNGPGLQPQQTFGAWVTLGFPNTLPNGMQLIWGYSLFNLWAALLLIWLVARAPERGLLASTPLSYLGRISYAGYLWHFPLAHLCAPLVYRIHELTGWGLMPCLLLWFGPYLALVIAVSAASARWVEKPFLDLKQRWPASPQAGRHRKS